MRRRGLLGAGIIMLLLAPAFVPPAEANNLWNGYHWGAENAAQLQMVNTVSTSLTKFKVQAAVSEWAQGNTGIEPTYSTTSGPVTISAKFGGNYLGLAQIWLENGHITKGKVVVNTLYYNSLDDTEWDQVLCQEIGHVLGLDHRESGEHSCMNDHELGYDSPDGHDYDMLTLLYASHDEPPPGGGGPCRGGPKKCANGQWITVHVFPAPGR